MRIAMAWLAAGATYVVVAWLVRFLLTVLTLPFAGLLPSPRPLPVLRAMRLLGSAACGFGGFLAAAIVLARLGQRPRPLLGVMLGVVVAALHVPGLRRLTGGPQLVEERYSLVGEELGILAAAGWWIAV